MKDTRLFKTEEEYNSANVEYPNVSYTEDTKKVWVKEKEDEIIITSESNPFVMRKMYENGYAANENYMTKSEAEKVTYFESFNEVFFESSSETIYGEIYDKEWSFDELKYFINISNIGQFYGQEKLTSITIPSGVKFIGNYAFNNCRLLSSVTFEEVSQINFIGVYAFSNCTSLTSITITNSVTSIGKCAFENCESLSEITIPSGVTLIEAWAFNDCKSLSEIICLAKTAPTIYDKTFDGIPKNGALKVTSGSDYSTWMSTEIYYLGYYNWTINYIE